MKFPKRLRHRGRGKVLATIYKRPDGYRLYWRARVDGKPRSRFKDYPSYAAAKRQADQVVVDLAKGSEAAKLTAGQASDALAALEGLQRFYQSTGRRVSLRAAVADYCEAATKLSGYTLGEAVERFLATAATVRRKDLGEAVEEFIEDRKHLAESKEGKRAQLSKVYAYNVGMWLREFAAAFPGHAVCDLAKEHVNAYMAQHRDLSAKSRNDRRAVVRMFLGWCVKQDYLSRVHRLFEATGMNRETVDAQEIDYYQPAELASVLEHADSDLCPVIALGGLAGLRGEEIMRLDWSDVWRVPGHVEIKAIKSKTRQRRLVEICPALEQWLSPYRQCTGPVWGKSIDAWQEGFAALRDTLKIPARRNGLRHSFCTYHFALNSNENLTAAQAGNSPAMIHQHYKGLATKAEAERWFAVAPTPANVIKITASRSA